jgi:hypothetical protein
MLQPSRAFALFDIGISVFNLMKSKPVLYKFINGGSISIFCQIDDRNNMKI